MVRKLVFFLSLSLCAQAAAALDAALPLDSLGPDARGEAEAAIAEARAYIAPAGRPACETKEGGNDNG